MTEKLSEYIRDVQIYFQSGLDRYLPPASSYPPSVHQSMRYSALAEGKRIRPALALAAFELCGGNRSDERILLAGCALEMLHAFSLIHDDLPCMDDDDFRRGKPTNHRVYGEAVAVLGGDALCIHAFELLGRTGDCRLVTEVARALGTGGMIGGQIVDIEMEGKKADLETLRYIHLHKTAALLSTSLCAGALLAGAPDPELAALRQYGENIGLAFQVADDILDVEGTTEQIGKDAHSDEERGKLTYPALLGLLRSKEIARELVENAKKSLNIFGAKADLLRDTSDYVIERMK